MNVCHCPGRHSLDVEIDPDIQLSLASNTPSRNGKEEKEGRDERMEDPLTPRGEKMALSPSGSLDAGGTNEGSSAPNTISKLLDHSTPMSSPSPSISIQANHSSAAGHVLHSRSPRSQLHAPVSSGSRSRTGSAALLGTSASPRTSPRSSHHNHSSRRHSGFRSSDQQDALAMERSLAGVTFTMAMEGANGAAHS